MNVKPIETQYKGYRFRSRLEARWAVFFDALGVEWEYEPEGFDLGDIYYLPDFRITIPGKDGFRYSWIEIKSRIGINDADLQKCLLLNIKLQNPVLVTCGDPVDSLEKIKDEINEVELRISGCLNGELIPLSIMEAGFFFGLHTHEEIVRISKRHDRVSKRGRMIPADIPDFLLSVKDALMCRQAADRARSARFEHGENGA